ncbi:MAG: glycosyl hydrolase family 28-related protein, partial [Candidatus Hydrogenedentales bacterium]
MKHAILDELRRSPRLVMPLFAVGILIAAVGCPSANQIWRSALYPSNWTPAFEDNAGRYLHDFSYAGYRYGEDNPPSPAPGAVFNAVTGYAADNTGATDATAAIQDAIDDASLSGGVVFLPAGLYRFDGVLNVVAPGVVIQGEGPELTRLYFTKTDAMAYNAHINFRGNVVRGPDILLAQDAENRSFDVFVADASSLTVGDEVSLGWVITDEFVEEHAMTGTWVVFNGLWKPIFRRTVVAIDTAASPHKVTFDVPLRYVAKVRDGASLRKESGYL